jgi:hypothetical protein
LAHLSDVLLGHGQKGQLPAWTIIVSQRSLVALTQQPRCPRKVSIVAQANLNAYVLSKAAGLVFEAAMAKQMSEVARSAKRIQSLAHAAGYGVAEATVLISDEEFGPYAQYWDEASTSE